MPLGKPPTNGFKPGISGNPAGRVKGSFNKFSMRMLYDEIALASKRKKKSIYKHFVEKAYESERVLIALMKKIIPDLSNVQMEVNGEENPNPLQDLTKEDLLKLIAVAQKIRS